MNPRWSKLIIIALALGAILYSGSSVLGNASNTIMAGALSAKPNGVPTCLTACGTVDNDGPDNDGDADDLPANTHHRVVVVPSHTVVVHHRNTVTRDHHRVVRGHAVSASAQATAVAVVGSRTLVVHQMQPTVLTTTTSPVTVTTDQTQPQPVVVHTIAARLPATGMSIGTAIGATAMILATYFFLRRRSTAPPRS